MSEVATILCSSEALMRLNLLSNRFICWLHFEGPAPEALESIVRKLVSSGCVQISISGERGEAIHDEIDQILVDCELASDAVTTWHPEGLDNVAWDFANVDFASAEASLRVIAVFGTGTSIELQTLSAIAASLKRALA